MHTKISRDCLVHICKIGRGGTQSISMCVAATGLTSDNHVVFNVTLFAGFTVALVGIYLPANALKKI